MGAMVPLSQTHFLYSFFILYSSIALKKLKLSLTIRIVQKKSFSVKKKHVIGESGKHRLKRCSCRAGLTYLTISTSVKSHDVVRPLTFCLFCRAEDLKLEWKQRKERLKESDVDLDFEFSDDDKRRYKEKVR